MTKLDQLSTQNSTSSAGEKHIAPPQDPGTIGCLVSGLGTSVVYSSLPDSMLRSQRTTELTSSGDMMPPAVWPGSAIAELRRLTGFTWDQLARILGVTRRSLHSWSNGKRGTSRNEEHLQRVLAVIRKIDRGYSHENRAAILQVRDDGIIPYELLIKGDYDRFFAVLGPGRPLPFWTPPKISLKEVYERYPLPKPWVLASALEDFVHPGSGTFVASFPLETKRRE